MKVIDTLYEKFAEETPNTQETIECKDVIFKNLKQLGLSNECILKIEEDITAYGESLLHQGFKAGIKAGSNFANEIREEK